MSKKYQHIIRLLIVAAFVIIGFLIARPFFIPKTFWEFGHYRGDSVRDNASFPQNYSQSRNCKMCHEENYTKWKNQSHKSVTCENCHGPLQKHTEDPSSQKPERNYKREFCGLCHAENISRPINFPQVNLKEHNPGQQCIDCHNPHEPKL